ncbi:MAG: TetR/AcrR family transcriptional regulator [Cytophagaceae bacterium]|jgi:AcrR family transcriptional regulator|nr:TetR/AcrR family transcriptional regulator [Cytophagaceae bacterium]
MSGTKERILTTALELFNEQGSDAVSIRDISGAMEISSGNLTYHYKNTDEMIVALYFQLVEKSNALFSAMQSEKIDIHFLMKSSHATFRLIEEYRFLFLDMVRIMRRMPELYAHYLELMKIRKMQLKYSIQMLVQNGYLQKRILDPEFANYEDICFILGDFWLSSAELLFKGTSEQKIKKYLDMTFYPFKPFLTKKGWDQLEL